MQAFINGGALNITFLVPLRHILELKVYNAKNFHSQILKTV